MSRRLAGAVAAAALLVTGCAQPASRSTEVDCGPVTVTGISSDITPVPEVAAPALPVTVTSADGTEVTVTDISRILAVNLYGSLAEIVFSLGLGGHAVGRDTATTLPAAAHLPLVTPAGHDLSAEGVLALDPTVVLADATIGPPEVLAQLRRAGIPVVLIDDERSLAAIPRQIRQVATALGVPQAGEQLVLRVTTELDNARASVHSDSRLRVAFLYLRGNVGVYLMAGEGTGADAMIEAIGAEDAGTAIGLSGFRPLTSEGLINAAPDVILVMSQGLASVGGVDGLLDLPGVDQTPAGAHRRIVDIADGALLNFGVRTGEAVAALADAVHGACR